jgi:4-hydroxybenzoate polyprenyltransferase
VSVAGRVDDVDDAVAVEVNNRPLVVDLDGTLIKSGLLSESFLALLSNDPLRALSAMRHGRAERKAAIAEATAGDFHALAFNDELLVYLRQEKAKGRRIFLATDAHEKLAQGVAAHIGLFDGIFASDGSAALKGAAKAELLCRTFGRGNFDYAGSNKADMNVWHAAAGVLVVGGSPGLIRTVSRIFPHAAIMMPRTTGVADYARALRPHQWLKNLLVFVPTFTAHHFDAASLLAALLAFFSFSLCASSAYVLNDLLDMRSDRDHPTKRHRPFAGRQVSILHGILLFPAALIVSAAIALALPGKFMLALALYYALTLSYSLYLKRQILLDVIVLACLYDMRLVGGAAAAAVVLSPWILTFSVFLFLSLALVKRWAELIERIEADRGNPTGRGYLLTDLPLLQAMATASGYVAVLVFGLYINSSTVSALYREPETLWAIPLILLYWISRILILTHRGQMHDDPVLFAAKDRTSVVCGLLMILAVVAGI